MDDDAFPLLITNSRPQSIEAWLITDLSDHIKLRSQHKIVAVTLEVGLQGTVLFLGILGRYPGNRTVQELLLIHVFSPDHLVVRQQFKALG